MVERKGPCTPSAKFRFNFFPYLSSFPVKMHATDLKTQKIEPDPNSFMTDESFGGSV